MAHSSKVQTKSPGLNRREFLYYALGGSIVLATCGAAAGLLRYMTPEPEKIDTTRYITLSTSELPIWGSVRSISHNNFPYGFFCVKTDNNALVAFYPRCTFRVCLIHWVDTNYRFECPCCGSKFRIDGSWIEGIASRNLDRYFTEVTFSDGTTATSNETGDPIPLLGREIASVTIDTRTLIPGPARQK